MRPAIISDTTLRDGIQMPGARTSVPGHLAIAGALERAGVRSIEVGFPANGAAEIERIEAVAATVRRSLLLALCRTRTEDVDAAARAFAGIPRMRCGVNLFVATSAVHRERRLRRSPAELVDMTAAAVRYARRTFRFVSFSAEDAARTEPEVLLEIYDAAVEAGATTIGFPDTLGVLLPDDVAPAIEPLCTRYQSRGVRVAVHFHDDFGMATANTVAALGAGADVAQCTVNGMGERAGNAALEEVVTVLAVRGERLGRSCSVDPAQLTALSRIVVEQTGVQPSVYKAVTGRNVFVTEAGLHQDGLLKDRATFLPFMPELVGAAGVELVLGPYSGRSAAAAFLAAAGREATPASVDALLERLKTSGADRPRIRLRDAP